MWFKENVAQKKKFLASMLKSPFTQLGQICSDVWHEPDRLTTTLQQSLCKLPHSQLLYAIDTSGHQTSDNISRQGTDHRWRGQDLSMRPYFNCNLPFKGMMLSETYISQRSMQPCITVLQAVRQDENLLGFVAADFHLKDLPNLSASPLQSGQWSLGSGDHAMGSALSMLRRNYSNMDENIDYLIYVMATLLQEHGIFHCNLHFASDRCMLWSLDDPLHYRLHSMEELMKSELFLQYPKRDYDSAASVATDRIPLVFAQLKALRVADDITYLRSGSLNVMNGMVGLTFSKDGSQYLHVDEFLNRDLAYWVEQPNGQENAVQIKTPN